jgi:hypothetical protein
MFMTLSARTARRARIIASCLALAAFGGCERPADAALTADQASSQVPAVIASDEAIRIFVSGSEEEIIRAVQDGTDFSTEPDLKWFSMLSDIWYERADSHPDFAWGVLKSSRVRVVVGSQLAQAYRNKLVPLNIQDIRKFALANYANPDNRVARSSVLLLGEAGNPTDVPLLEQLARSGAGGRRLYKEAVTALVHICGEDAERTIEALLPVGSEDDRQFTQGWLSNRDHLVRSWCN